MWTLWTVETTDIYLWTTLTDVQDVMGNKLIKTQDRLDQSGKIVKEMRVR